MDRPLHRSTGSLQGRILRAVMSLMLLGMVLVAATVWINGRQAAWDSYDRLLLGAANDIAESIFIQNGHPVVDLPVSAFELLAQARDDRIAYAVRGPHHQLITGYADTPFAADTRPNRNGEQLFDAPMQGEPARYVEITRLFAERNFSGAVHISVGQTLRARKDMTLHLVTDALWPAAIAGVLLLVSAYVIIHVALRPVEKIAADLATRDPYDLTPVPTENVPAEIEVMLAGVNRFMARLERQLEMMRNLISDSAHQLRTPVAAIRAQAEAIHETTDPELRQRQIERLTRRTRSLGRLLDQLLSRAMVTHRTDSIPRAPLDLRDVALEVLEHHDHRPELDLRFEIGPDPVVVAADAFSLEQALGNLVSNALTHGKAPVTIGTALEGSLACLWVADAGPGPAEDLTDRLGQRFARSHGSAEGGSGIGLSIVYAVAHAFGGGIRTEQSDHGFRISLVLPAANLHTTSSESTPQ
ncbi:sensor histidine kinase N-terminal domain-containing protein [Thioclava sp. GXIMD2076]|uniref:histidine kinase n=1 Tax=Thioclava kandeliae TaxID=3070818 RepID=A0ABV1SEG6_9RHOB